MLAVSQSVFRVMVMFRLPRFGRGLLCIVVLTCSCGGLLLAQETTSQQSPPQEISLPKMTPVATERITLPAGTRLSLMLQTGITTRTAKPGDSVYFQTTFPIAQENRIVIPMGTFVRGEIVSVKRPGRLKGRAELQMRITSLTFRNGYVVSLVGYPGSGGDETKESVDNGGKIVGSSDIAKDVATVSTTTLVGIGIGTYGGLVGGIANGSVHAFGAGLAAGGGAGLLAGLITVAFTRGPDAELHAGTTLDVLFDHPLALDAAHLPPNDPGVAPVPSPMVPAPDRHRHRRASPSLWPMTPLRP